MEAIERLALDADPRVRLAVAMKNKLSKELMLTMAHYSDPSMRARIAFNKNTNDDELRLLAVDSLTVISQVARCKLSLRGA